MASSLRSRRNDDYSVHAKMEGEKDKAGKGQFDTASVLCFHCSLVYRSGIVYQLSYGIRDRFLALGLHGIRSEFPGPHRIEIKYSLWTDWNGCVIWSLAGSRQTFDDAEQEKTQIISGYQLSDHWTVPYRCGSEVFCRWKLCQSIMKKEICFPLKTERVLPGSNGSDRGALFLKEKIEGKREI